MPIYEETYRGWEGRLAERPKSWWVIAKAGIRLLWKRGMMLIILLSAIPFVVRAVQIYLLTRFGDNTQVLEAIRGFQVNPAFFMSFLQGQHFFLILVMIIAGAGLIAGDRRLNALPLYFSKPVGFGDYLGGKFLVLFFYGGLVTLVPGLALFILRLLLSRDGTFFAENYWVIFSITGFVILKLTVMGALVLALSSLTRNTRLAAIAFFLVLTFPEMLRRILPKVTSVALLSLNADMTQVGAAVFGENVPYAFPAWQAALLLVISLGVYAVVLRVKVRPTEVIQ